MAVTIAARPGTASPLRMMVASAIIMFASVGIGFYGISVLVDQLVQSVGFTVGAVGLATSVFLVASCLTNPLISAGMRLFGVRWTMVAGGVLSAVALVMVATVESPALLLVAFLVLGVGSAACSFLPVSTMLVGLEKRRRSLGMTIGYSGGTLGGVVLAPLMLASSLQLGFVATTFGAAALMLVVVTFGSLVLLPAGFVASQTTAAAPTPSTEAPAIGAGSIPSSAASAAAHLTLRGAVATPTFWWLLAALAITGSTSTAVQLQLLSIARFAELPDPATATIVLALSVAASRFVGVGLLRMLSTRSVSILTCAIQALAFAIIAFAPSTLAFLVGAGLVGASIGLSVLLSSLLTVDAFGQRHFGTIYSVILTITGIANGFIPVLIGWWYDPETGYTFSLVVFGASCVLAAGCFAFVRLAASEPRAAAAASGALLGPPAPGTRA